MATHPYVAINLCLFHCQVKKLDVQHANLEQKLINYEQMMNTPQDYASYFCGDIFISCLGTTLKQAGSRKSQWRIDLQYPYQAAKLAFANGVANMVMVSSSGANPRSLNFYLRMKGRLEQKVESIGYRRLVILQPSLLLGKRNHRRLAEELGGRALPLICRVPGLTKFRPIHASLVARKIVLVCKQHDAGVKRLRLDKVFPE